VVPAALTVSVGVSAGRSPKLSARTQKIFITKAKSDLRDLTDINHRLLVIQIFDHTLTIAGKKGNKSAIFALSFILQVNYWDFYELWEYFCKIISN
jgi:hypothetical protein